jgi:hypothetical protein
MDDQSGEAGPVDLQGDGLIKHGPNFAQGVSPRPLEAGPFF